MTNMVHRVETHAHVQCDGCGASGADQYRHDTGRPAKKGAGRFELRCRCGHVTVYDLGCSRERHQAVKASLATFRRATLEHQVHIDQPDLFWGVCPWCASHLMYRLRDEDDVDGVTFRLIVSDDVDIIAA